jgi:hypothetical protein
VVSKRGPAAIAASVLGILACGKTGGPETIPPDAGPAIAAASSRGPDALPDGEARALPPLAFTSRTVDLTMAFGGTDSREVRLTGTLARSARLEIDAVEPPGPEATVLPADPETSEGVRLTLTGTRVGRSAGQVTVKTGLPDPASLTLLYSWQVTGNLSVDPTNPVLYARASTPASIAVRVSSRRADFRLEKAAVVTGPFTASFVRDTAAPDASAYSVRVVVTRGSNDDQRGAIGTLRLVSNDPAEPIRDVPLFVLGSRAGAP